MILFSFSMLSSFIWGLSIFFNIFVERWLCFFEYLQTLLDRMEFVAFLVEQTFVIESTKTVVNYTILITYLHCGHVY